MPDPVLERLLRAAVEAEAFARPIRRLRLASWWLLATSGAAALLALVFMNPRSVTRYRTIPAKAISIEHVSSPVSQAGQRIDVLQPCLDTAAAALVLLRVWDRDCSCLQWQVHEFEDGSTITEMARGEAVQIPVDVSHAPPIEQSVLLAVARRASDLPSTVDAREDLLACLNGVCPPSLPDEASCGNPDVLPCLGEGITLVQRPFVAD